MVSDSPCLWDGTTLAGCNDRLPSIIRKICLIWMLNPGEPSRTAPTHPNTTTLIGMLTVGALPMHCAVRLFAPVT